MMLQRMDNVLIVVDDLEAAKAFFVELGMELEGETTVEGPSVDRLIGLRPCYPRADAHSGRPRTDRAGQVPHAGSDQNWARERSGERTRDPPHHVRRR